MAALRYNDDPYAGMPDYLRSTVKKNLATTDASVSAFNDWMKFFPMQTTAKSVPAVPRSSFSFTLNGGNDTQQLSLNGVSSSGTANGVPQTDAVPQAAQANGTDNWRFKSFGPSLLDTKPVSLTGPNSTFQSSPDAYAVNPDAYHQVISTYKPKDMTEERQKYGWGGGQ
jgi:hypothetical protein